MIEKEVSTLCLLSIEMISERLGIGVRTLWRWVSQGRFPRPDVAVGRIRRWRTATVEEWIRNSGKR